MQTHAQTVQQLLRMGGLGEPRTRLLAAVGDPAAVALCPSYGLPDLLSALLNRYRLTEGGDLRALGLPDPEPWTFPPSTDARCMTAMLRLALRWETAPSLARALHALDRFAWTQQPPEKSVRRAFERSRPGVLIGSSARYLKLVSALLRQDDDGVADALPDVIDQTRPGLRIFVREAFVLELVPWALGLRDPVAERLIASRSRQR